MRLPSSPYYGCHAAADGLRSPLVEIDVDVAAGGVRRDLLIRRPAPAPQAVVNWIREQGRSRC